MAFLSVSTQETAPRTLRVHCPAADPYLSQAERHARSGARLWLRLSLRVDAELGNLREPARIRSPRPARRARPAPARHDRLAVVHLGAGVGRVRGIARHTSSRLFAGMALSSCRMSPTDRARASTASKSRRPLAGSRPRSIASKRALLS